MLVQPRASVVDHMDGSEEWTHQFGTSTNDWVLGVAVDAMGVRHGTTRGVLPGQTSPGPRDALHL